MSFLVRDIARGNIGAGALLNSEASPRCNHCLVIGLADSQREERFLESFRLLQMVPKVLTVGENYVILPYTVLQFGADL